MFFAELDRLKAAARERGATLVDLGIGSPDIPCRRRSSTSCARGARPSAHGYPPFRGIPRFFESIGRYMQSRFDVTIDPPREAIALSGAKEGLAQLVMSLCGPGDSVLVPEIYYPGICALGLAEWRRGELVPMRARDGFSSTSMRYRRGSASREGAHRQTIRTNPTGARVELEFFERAVAFARQHDLLLVSDLAYSELTFDGTPAPSALQVDGALDVTIEFHSFSKTFSMAGLRIGFAVGNCDAIEALRRIARTRAMEHPRRAACGRVCARPPSRARPPKVAAYRARRDAMVAAFAAAGWTIPIPSASMYCGCPCPRESTTGTGCRR
jgi:aspartate/methionine/tyrosine aminotransferase